MKLAKVLLFLFSILILASIVNAQLILKEDLFYCDKNKGFPGDLITCTGKYTVDSGAPGKVVLETCIAPSGGFSILTPLEQQGSCVPGETFCYHNTVIANSPQDKGTSFTLKYKLLVPEIGRAAGSKFFSRQSIIQRTSVNQCCITGSCTQVLPYGWSSYGSSFTILDENDKDDDRDGIPNPSDKCPNTDLRSTPVDSSGCPQRIWEICKDSLGEYACKSSSHLDYAMNVFLPPDYSNIKICSLYGLSGTGFGYLTEEKCLQSINSVKTTTAIWTRCTDDACIKGDVEPNVQVLLLCSQQGKTDTNERYASEEECKLKIDQCSGNEIEKCLNNQSIVYRRCVEGAWSYENSCPEIITGKSCGESCIPVRDTLFDDSGPSVQCAPVIQGRPGWCFDAVGSDDRCTYPGWNRTTYSVLFSDDICKKTPGPIKPEEVPTPTIDLVDRPLLGRPCGTLEKGPCDCFVWSNEQLVCNSNEYCAQPSLKLIEQQLQTISVAGFFKKLIGPLVYGIRLKDKVEVAPTLNNLKGWCYNSVSDREAVACSSDSECGEIEDVDDSGNIIHPYGKCNKKTYRCEPKGALGFLEDWAKAIEDLFGVSRSIAYIILGVIGLVLLTLLFKFLSPEKR